MATQKVAPKKSAQRKAAKAVARRTTPRPQQIMIRTSERRDFRRCRQRWWWGWRDGLKTPWVANSLWFGEGVHIALAAWYLPGTERGPHPAGTFSDWVGDERRRIYTLPNVEIDETKIVDALDLGVAMLTNYVETYGEDSNMEFISIEQTFQIWVPALVDGIMDTLYLGTFDGVYRDWQGRIWLIEHKTATAIQITHLPLDDQAGSYWAVATQVLREMGLIGAHEELEGIMYNFLRKAMPDTRQRNREGMYLNQDGSISKKQPSAYFHREPVFRFPRERATQFKRIADESLEMQMVRRGELPVTKNPTRDCPHDCSFFTMCQLQESGDDWEDYRDAIYKVEDPYADHRKSAAG